MHHSHFKESMDCEAIVSSEEILDLEPVEEIVEEDPFVPSEDKLADLNLFTYNLGKFHELCSVDPLEMPQRCSDDLNMSYNLDRLYEYSSTPCASVDVPIVPSPMPSPSTTVPLDALYKHQLRPHAFNRGVNSNDSAPSVNFIYQKQTLVTNKRIAGAFLSFFLFFFFLQS
jgi:hypothetical protein